ncbi:MAG: hypothetical protein GC160_01260 [Acidobacteria bacterium]|nr:hypothetical protein [Acidobacteriota bacterium]
MPGADGRSLYRVRDPFLEREALLEAWEASEGAGRLEVLRPYLRLGRARVAEIFEMRADGEGAYLVSRLPRGESLARRLAAAWAPNPDGVVRLLEQTAEALNQAHRAGLAHGALGPSCIVLDERDDTVVTDFWGAASRGVAPSPGDDQAALARLAAELLRACETEHRVSAESWRALETPFAGGCGDWVLTLRDALTPPPPPPVPVPGTNA